MRRDPLPAPVKRSIASATSSRFFMLAHAIAKSNEPTQTQLEALERSYNATGQYVMDSDEFRELTLEVHAQGSRATGTIVRPMRLGAEGFDIDIVVRLRRGAYDQYGGKAAGLINDLYTVVRRYADMHRLKIQRWERCITLEYADGMCVDITPIIEDERVGAAYGATHARVPDRQLQRFEPTNPKGLAHAFDDAARVRAVFTGQQVVTMDSVRANLQPLPDAQDVQGRLLSQLVQLMKLHRNVAFAGAREVDFSPRSVFITSLAASAYATRAPIPHDSPLDLLLDIVEVMPMFIEQEPLAGGGEFWQVPNLTAPGDNLASGMNTPGRQQAFIAWHRRLRQDVQRLLDCIERREGLDPLIAIVKEAFGERSAAAVGELEAPRLMQSNARRIVTVGTAVLGTTLAVPARAHTFFGAE